MIVVQPRKIQVKIGDDVHEVRVPSNAMLKQFMDGNGSDLERTIDLLDKCGLNKDICWDLDAESLQKIVEAISPEKKQ